MCSLIVPPTREPLDIEEVKKQRKFPSDTLDTLFDLWISAAREYLEEQTGRQLMTATWEYWLSGAPTCAVIELPRPPLQDVLSVTYDDADGVEQTLDPALYRVIAPAGPYCRRGSVQLLSGSSWPALQVQTNALRIRFLAGYGNVPGAVSPLIKYALLMLVGHFHKFGEEVNEARAQPVPLGAAAVISSLKYTALPSAPLRRVVGAASWPAPWGTV